MSEQLAHPELPEDPTEGLTGVPTVFLDVKVDDELEEDINQAIRLYNRYRERDVDITERISLFRAKNVDELRQRIADMKARRDEIRTTVQQALRDKGFNQQGWN